MSNTKFLSLMETWRKTKKKLNLFPEQEVLLIFYKLFNGKSNFLKFWLEMVKQSLHLDIPSACNFIKKEALAQMFSCEFCKNFKNRFSYRTPPLAATVALLLPINAVKEFTHSGKGFLFLEKHFPRGGLMKRCSGNMLPIYRKAPMLTCFSMGVLLQICCIFSEPLFARTSFRDCFFLLCCAQRRGVFNPLNASVTLI